MFFGGPMEYRHGQEKLKIPVSQPQPPLAENLLHRNTQDKYWRPEDLQQLIRLVCSFGKMA